MRKLCIFLLMILRLSVQDDTSYDVTHSEKLQVYFQLVKELNFLLFSRPRIRSEGPTEDVRYDPLLELEFPGTSGEKLKRLALLWDTYYDCLTAQYHAERLSRTIPPKAVSVLVGGTVNLPCVICYSPAFATLQVTWWFARTLISPGEQMYEYDFTVAEIDDSLSLHKVTPDNAGLYWCQSGSTKSFPYFVHVFGDKEPVVKVRPRNATSGPYPRADNDISGSLRLTTEWTDWNQCSQCGKVGRRTKFGSCTVIGPKFNPVAFSSNEPMAILNYFVDGLPCRSPLLPRQIADLKSVQERPNEVMVGYCKVACSDQMFEVFNENGELIQSVNNSAGVYSPMQGPPKLPPMIRREIKFPRLGDRFIVSCPGSGIVNTPTEWLVSGHDRIQTSFANVTSRGRVFIDERDRIVFERVEISDGHRYTCFQNRELVGMVTVIPVKKNNPNILQVDGLLIAILASVLLLCYMVLNFLQNRKLIDALENIS